MNFISFLRDTFDVFSPVTTNYRLEVSALSDKGKEREQNEDHLAYSLSSDENNLLAVVADGMGGYQGGAEASQLVVNQLLTNAPQILKSPITIRGLKQQLALANKRLFDFSRSQLDKPGMGTTAVVLLIRQGIAAYAFVGDSRLYRIRDGHCQQLSVDHTLVAQLLRDELITEEQAANHPDRHVITRALGTDEFLEVDSCLQTIPISIGDSYLLCSDGLYDLLSDTDLAQIISQYSATEACQHLVNTANARGGYDNISALIVKVQAINTTKKSIPVTRT